MTIQNKALIYSWLVEGMVRIILSAIIIFDPENQATRKWFKNAVDILIQVNIYFFMVLIFKLKTVLIYMGEELNSEQDIEKGLQRLKCYKIIFAVFSLTGLTDGFAGFSSKNNLLEVDE